MATPLQQDILRLLAELSSSPGNGSTAASKAADHSGAYPLPWLLLDLEQLLPPGCQLAQWLQADDARLCRRLEAAQDDRQQACRMAAVMLEAITADVYSSRQLVELLCQNSDLLSLCEDTVGSLSASRAALAQAAAGMCNAAWQLVGRKAEQLEAARQCRDAAAAAAVRMLQNAAAGEAAAATVQALHVATLLTDVSGWAQRALLQHGPTIAGSLQLAAQAWVEGSLPESSQDRLSRLLAMWAAEAPWHASAAARRAEAKALTPPCLGIAGLFLDTALPPLLAAPPSLQQLTADGPAASLETVLDSIADCACSAVQPRVRAAALELLMAHTAGLADLLAAYLQHPLLGDVGGSQASGSQPSQPAAAAASSKGSDSSAAAADQLLPLVAVTIACLAGAAEADAVQLRQALGGRRVQALQAALLAVVGGTAACLSWMPAKAGGELQYACRDARNRSLLPLFLQPSVRLPPLTPRQQQQQPAQPEGSPAAEPEAAVQPAAEPAEEVEEAAERFYDMDAEAEDTGAVKQPAAEAAAAVVAVIEDASGRPVAMEAASGDAGRAQGGACREPKGRRGVKRAVANVVAKGSGWFRALRSLLGA